jgi:hypothetical protein
MIRSLAIALLIVALLVDSAAGSTPAGRQYAVWSQDDAHSGVVVSDDGRTASADSLGDGWASVRTTIAVSSGAWYWETAYSYTGTANVSGGVATAALPLTDRPGGDHQSAPLGATLSMQSYGGPDKFGDCYVNAMAFANVSAIGGGDVIRHWLDLDVGVYRVSVNGSEWTIVAKRDWLGIDGRFYDFEAGAWHGLAGLHTPEGTEAIITANFGQEPFAYDVPAGAHAGLYTDGPMIFLSGFEPGA